MYELLKADLKRQTSNPNLPYIMKSYLSSKSKQAQILYRISNFLYRKNLKYLSILIKNYNIRTTGCEIGEQISIGKGFKIGHANGIVISGEAIIGENLTILQQVTIGSKGEWEGLYPIIGNNVSIGSGAKVLGNITIGDNVIIGANSVVVSNVPDDCTVTGIPARIIKEKGKRIEVAQ